MRGPAQFALSEPGDGWRCYSHRPLRPVGLWWLPFVRREMRGYLPGSPLARRLAASRMPTPRVRFADWRSHDQNRPTSDVLVVAREAPPRPVPSRVAASVRASFRPRAVDRLAKAAAARSPFEGTPAYHRERLVPYLEPSRSSRACLRAPVCSVKSLRAHYAHPFALVSPRSASVFQRIQSATSLRLDRPSLACLATRRARTIRDASDRNLLPQHSNHEHLHFVGSQSVQACACHAHPR